MQIHGHEIVLTKQDKILFPDDGITKGDLIRYYDRVTKYMLPYMKDRPLAMQRFPEGIQQEGFYQKNASDYFPNWIKTIKVKKEGGWVNHVVCNDKETLLYLVNQGVITFHLWLSSADELNHPDKMVFDLDPPDGNFELVIKGAKLLKNILDQELDFKTYVMTTGSRGLHIITPLSRTEDYDEVHNFAKQVAMYLVSKNPAEFTTAMKKDQRKGKLFIDYLRNSYAQLVVAPFSVRPLTKAPVATPIAWDELDGAILNSQTYTISNVFKRLEHQDDPWKGLDSHAKSIKKPKKVVQELLGSYEEKD